VNASSVEVVDANDEMTWGWGDVPWSSSKGYMLPEEFVCNLQGHIASELA
jgi:hypothetical protein